MYTEQPKFSHHDFYTVESLVRDAIFHSSTPMLLEFSSQQVLTALLGINNSQNSSELSFRVRIVKEPEDGEEGSMKVMIESMVYE